MATILILEPHAEVRDLLERIVRRLGHEPVLDTGSLDVETIGVDVVLAEPAGQGTLERIRTVAAATGASVVCVSIYPPSEGVSALKPVAYLLKPFSLIELERALLTALGRVEPASSR